MAPEQEIVLVAPQDREEELSVRLGRIGFDRVAGYLREPEAAFLTTPDRVDRGQPHHRAQPRHRDEGTRASGGRRRAQCR